MSSSGNERFTCGSSSRSEIFQQHNSGSSDGMMRMEDQGSVPSLRSLLQRAHTHPGLAHPSSPYSSSSRFLDVLSLHSSSSSSFNITEDSIGSHDMNASGPTVLEILDRAMEMTNPSSESSAGILLDLLEEEGMDDDWANTRGTRRTTSSSRRGGHRHPEEKSQ